MATISTLLTHLNADGTFKDGYVLISYPNDVITKITKEGNAYYFYGPTEDSDEELLICHVIADEVLDDWDISDFLMKLFVEIG